MPGMDGPSTLAALRALPQTSTTPVIFMTAKVQPQEFAQYKAVGVLDVIAKPFDPMTLSATIKSIWSRYQLPSVQAAIQALSDSYIAQLPNKLATMEATWESLPGTGQSVWTLRMVSKPEPSPRWVRSQRIWLSSCRVPR